MVTKYIQLVLDSLLKATRLESSVVQSELESCFDTRMVGCETVHLLSNLCASELVRVYLNVGIWRGASFIPPLLGTDVRGIGVDNWSQFGGAGAREIVNRSLRLRVPAERYHVIEGDAFEVPLPGEIADGTVDLYFYDGDHHFEAQQRAFTYYDRSFASTFVAVVDDWRNWHRGYKAKVGTLSAFESLGYRVPFHVTLDWSSGLFVAVVEKGQNNE